MQPILFLSYAVFLMLPASSALSSLQNPLGGAFLHTDHLLWLLAGYTSWHRAGRASSSSGGTEAAAPTGPEGAPRIPAWSSHFFLLANRCGASYSFFLLRCLLKHPRADPLCVFPGHFLRPGTNLPPSLPLSNCQLESKSPCALPGTAHARLSLAVCL